MNARLGLAVVASLGLSACAQVSEVRDLPGNILETPLTAEQAQADEILYQQRLAEVADIIRNQPRDGGYDPLVPIAGTDNWVSLPVAAEDERTISEEAWQEVLDYAGERNTHTVIVWRNGKIEYSAYWNDYTVDEEQISFSLAKPVTAAAVGRAIQLGYIDSLDQPVKDFLPEWEGTEKEGILVRHLLDMRSGFEAQDNGREANNILVRAYRHPRHEEIIINDVHMIHVPGERYEYNNATSELVAPVIERATGRTYQDFVSEEVLQKIGAMGGRIWLNRPGGVAHSGCCILIPADSFLRLAILLHQDGVWEGEQLYPEGYAEEVRTPTPQNPWAAMGAVYVAGDYIERRGAANPQTTTLGRTLHSEPYLDKDIYLFDGNGNQSVHISPHDDLVVLRTGRFPARDSGLVWDNTKIINTLIRGVKRGPGESMPEPQPGGPAS